MNIIPGKLLLLLGDRIPVKIAKVDGPRIVFERKGIKNKIFKDDLLKIIDREWGPPREGRPKRKECQNTM